MSPVPGEEADLNQQSVGMSFEADGSPYRWLAAGSDADGSCMAGRTLRAHSIAS
jgi:hypothetical protein